MKKSFKTDKLEKELYSLGVNISLLESAVKSFNNRKNRDFNYSHNDIANLFILLEKLIKISKEKLEKIEQYLI